MVLDDGRLEAIHRAIEDGQLWVVCGAGLSKSCGLPTWDEYIKELFKAANKTMNINGMPLPFEELREQFASATNTALAKWLQDSYVGNFSDLMRSVLYQNGTVTSKTLTELANLITKLHMKSCPGIINFNFDDLIEQEFQNPTRRAVKICPVFVEGSVIPKGHFPIFHVHGFLPMNRSEPNGGIVFSERSYHGLFEDSFSWSNLTQIGAYLGGSCLFIGLSLNDPNLRRLLDISETRSPRQEPKHFALLKQPDIIDQNVLKYVMDVRSADALALGIDVIWYRDHKRDIPSILSQIY